MHLRSITVRGFKSFPERMKLEFSPGVSVIVGPNGSGKSNITDAVLWALGAQSPHSVRGQTMQDVIFSGGSGFSGRSQAEVELELDNSDGRSAIEFSELSIARRVERSGEGEYRLNGARCRLADITEALSDAGLGKEMHSVVSQGQIEQIVNSKPTERRLVLEEAAGLGKHRARRHRARQKLDKTSQNLARALDVEQQARSRLGPLQKQAEAAAEHERLECELVASRLRVAADDLRLASANTDTQTATAQTRRVERDEANRLLEEASENRRGYEQEAARRSRVREELGRWLYGGRSASDRITARLERAREMERACSDAKDRRREELSLLDQALQASDASGGSQQKIDSLQTELEGLEESKQKRLAQRRRALESEVQTAQTESDSLQEELDSAKAAAEDAESRAQAARAKRREAEQDVEAARRHAASVGAELASVNQFLRTVSASLEGRPVVADCVFAHRGYELAVSSALADIFRAVICDTVSDACAVLDQSKAAGGRVLVNDGLGARGETQAPTADARRLLDHMDTTQQARAVLEKLLADVWVVSDIDRLDPQFEGVAVTCEGRVFSPSRRELSQTGTDGVEGQVLEQRNRQSELIAESNEAASREARAGQVVAELGDEIKGCDRAREQADNRLREMQRQVQQSSDRLAQLQKQLDRSDADEDDPEAVRRAELTAELTAERRLLERTRREHAQRLERAQTLRTRIENDDRLAESARRVQNVLLRSNEVVQSYIDDLSSRLSNEGEASEVGDQLRSLASRESELQSHLSSRSEALTQAEVAAQKARDQLSAAEARKQELEASADSMGVEYREPNQALTGPQRTDIETKIEALEAKRCKLGAPNPLAKDEYEEALEYVQRLEAQRTELESAMQELRGVISDADRRIRASFDETFQAAANNFSKVIEHLFPGGHGRLSVTHQAAATDSQDTAEATDDHTPDQDNVGVEVEVTPHGQSMRRLSLLSGGEKSLVALAFVFAVFLTRPSAFYILDEVEAALDDVNIDRFLALISAYSDMTQFIIVTHQKRTMAVADRLYGVSMRSDGISKVVSRKLKRQNAGPEADSEAVASYVAD
jgi:chromosome segregation protein